MTMPVPTDTSAQPMPPAIAALVAQSRALRAQLDAFDASVAAIAAGMQAAMARAAQQARREGDPGDAIRTPPVFGGGPTAAPDPTEAEALARIPDRPSPASQQES